MKIKHQSEQLVKKLIRDALSRHLALDQYQVFIFGSRIFKEGDDRADIDVGIKGKMPVEPATFSRLQDEMENLPFLYTVDLVDFSRVSEEFSREALKHTEPL